MKPEQAADTSKHVAPESPSFVWTRHAVAGSGESGEIVARTSSSTSSGATPAAARALRPAAAAMSDVFSPSPAMWRERMPVRG